MVLFSGLFQQFGHQSGPAGLMAGAKPRAVIAVKVFVELNELTPMGVMLELVKIAIHGTLSGIVTKKDVIEAAGNFRSDLPQCVLLSGPGWAFHGKVIAQEMMEFLQ
jgi:hypothetical protein